MIAALKGAVLFMALLALIILVVLGAEMVVLIFLGMKDNLHEGNDGKG